MNEFEFLNLASSQAMFFFVTSTFKNFMYLEGFPSEEAKATYTLKEKTFFFEIHVTDFFHCLTSHQLPRLLAAGPTVYLPVESEPLLACIALLCSSNGGGICVLYEQRIHPPDSEIVITML